MPDLPDQTPVATTADDRVWGMLAHLSAFSGYFTGLGWVLGPLIIWLVKRDQSYFAASQAKESLNFQITMLIANAIAVGVSIVTIFLCPIAVIVATWQLVLMILACIKANEGVNYRYPLTIRFL